MRLLFRLRTESRMMGDFRMIILLRLAIILSTRMMAQDETKQKKSLIFLLPVMA